MHSIFSASFKDPYDFRFLPVTDEAKELAIENAMVQNLRKLFLELGTGFSYMGNQYKITGKRPTNPLIDNVRHVVVPN